MMQFPSDTSVLDDVEFMQNNYGEYFHTLEIIDKSDEAVMFRISPVDDSKRSCEVQLTRQCYTIVSDTRRESGLIGQKCESLEQLLELIMGGKEFSSLLMRLTANKLNSSS